MCLSEMIAQMTNYLCQQEKAHIIIKRSLEGNLATQITSQPSPKCPCLAHSLKLG